MGNCGAAEEGKPTLLMFDCVSYGTHKIKTMNNSKLIKSIEELSRRINVPTNNIGEVLYQYKNLDKQKTIKELNIPYGAVLIAKIIN